jgi:vancomycin resistance protein YoaR
MLRPEQIAASLVIDSDESGKLKPHVDGALLRAAMKAELAALGIKEQVSTFTTHFAAGPGSPRSDNILLGAKKIDGVVVEPGETFSLNGVTGPRGYAQGYRDAPVIVNGRLGMGVGGGLSQLATTLFNAAYYAGMVDVEHRPHTIYFPNYPPVIEATIFYPSLDLKFRNGTGFGVLVDTSWTDDSITVSLWSTKVYESVTTMWEPKRDFAEPGVVSVPAGTDCIERQGAPGFAQDAWRILKKRGEQVKREKFSWRYDAEPRVTCA